VHGEPAADIVPHGRRAHWLSGEHLRDQLHDRGADTGLARLQLGVLNATDADQRTRRARPLALARTADPVTISEAVIVSWARLVSDCRAAGIQNMVKLTDALIAATAIEHGLAVITQDDDYERIAGAPSTPPGDLSLRRPRCPD
jgi:predicted nucleic acid-binding protein